MTDAATTREANPPQPEDDRTDSATWSCPISGQGIEIDKARWAVRKLESNVGFAAGADVYAVLPGHPTVYHRVPLATAKDIVADHNAGLDAAAAKAAAAADQQADNAWLDAPAATRRDLIWRAYRHIDSVFAYGLSGITDKLDRDHIIKAREDLHTALYGGRS